MPGQLFSDAERRRLGGFPAQVSHEDLVTYYTLTRSDRAKVNQYPDDAGRLGFALQLGALRHLEFCPDDLTSRPPDYAPHRNLPAAPILPVGETES